MSGLRGGIKTHKDALYLSAGRETDSDDDNTENLLSDIPDRFPGYFGKEKNAS